MTSRRPPELLIAWIYAELVGRDASIYGAEDSIGKPLDTVEAGAGPSTAAGTDNAPNTLKSLQNLAVTRRNVGDL
jgi:hypothetical protein